MLLCHLRCKSGPFTTQKQCIYNIKALLLDTEIRLFRLFHLSNCKQKLTHILV